MDDNSSDIDTNLNGYNLPSDSLWEIKRMLEKRYRSPFSEGLSPEGRLAMQQVLENEMAGSGKKRPENTNTKNDKNKRKQKEKSDDRRKRNISFSDSYKKSSSLRLNGDITDENFNELDQPKRAIGGKIETAMETIEIVKHGDADKEDDHAIEETAKLNSVEKCLVWMEVNDDATTTRGVPDSARSTTSVPGKVS